MKSTNKLTKMLLSLLLSWTTTMTYLPSSTVVYAFDDSETGAETETEQFSDETGTITVEEEGVSADDPALEEETDTESETAEESGSTAEENNGSIETSEEGSHEETGEFSDEEEVSLEETEGSVTEELPEETVSSVIEEGSDEELIEDAAEEEEEEAEPAAAFIETTGKTVLAFTSDTHNKEGNVAATRLGTWLDKMQAKYGKKVDVMAFGGDMANASASESAFWTLTQADMDQLDNRNVTGVYTTGNHEYSPGNYSNGKNSTTQVYIENQEGITGTNFRIYCLGSSAYAESGGGGGSWWGGGGWNQYTSSQITTLTNYLNGVNDGKPIIVITHYPLHYTSSRTISGAGDVIDALNAAAGSGKKIVYLWGHNHTDAPQTETNYDKIFKPGDTITYSNGQSKTIQFYYGAAGCMSDSEYGTGSGSVKGKGLIITIDDSNKLSFTYYDEAGNDVTTGGTFTEQDPVAIEGVTIDEAAEQGPVTVETGRTLTLHYTPVPADATINSVTWDSSNTSVATVDSTGNVKGVSAGTATITATISDGITRGQAIASVDIEVLPRSTSEPMYVLTDTLEPGKNYIIANKNNGEAYALTNNNGSVAKTAVEVIDGVIYTELENIVFSAEGSGSTVSSLGNNGRYIQASNYSLTLATSAQSGVTFAYGNDNKLTSRRGNSTYYIYYSTYNSGNFSGSTSSTSSSSPREVYLFEDVEGQIAVTGVTVTPAEGTIEARKTIQLTAEVTPSDATNKN
ncbi:MAG: Ig-like domain-containing protein, partial [Erysipelotrichaceae bacterium]|nr:Ig-like domain-containing protein [Erysipelotrichaceae bacterium]